MPQLERRLKNRVTATFIILQCAVIVQLSLLSISSDLVQAAESDDLKINDTLKNEVEPETIDMNEKLDWGTFYDPKEVFCGEFDCYKILGLDYLNSPTSKEITQSFRSLSRRWHPDKNRKKGAKERFVKIKKAHEILSRKKNRVEYDYYRDRPDEYFIKYGSSVMWYYAPKSDPLGIFIMLFILISSFTYFAQYQRWQTIANHIIKAAAEDWSTGQGGSVESMEIRRKALEIFAKQQQQEKDQDAKKTKEATNGVNGKSFSNRQAKKNAKLSKQDTKKQNNEALRIIIKELVDEIHDFGAGFHKPTMKDLFVVKLVTFPLKIAHAFSWRAKFYFRRLRRLPYSEEEIKTMTQISVGEIGWAAANESEKEKMLKLELWIPSNLEEWREEQKVKFLSSGDQKRFARTKKKQGKLA
jgi:curved DNA-binding protein CbpA